MQLVLPLFSNIAHLKQTVIIEQDFSLDCLSPNEPIVVITPNYFIFLFLLSDTISFLWREQQHQITKPVKQLWHCDTGDEHIYSVQDTTFV